MNFYNSETYISDLKAAIAATPGISELAGKSVMITGAGGLIGSFLTDMLLEFGKTDVYAVARNIDNLKKRFEGAKKEHLHLIKQDISMPLEFDFSVDYVIHAASNAYPAAFHNDPVGTIISNITGTHSLLVYAKDCGAKRFLFISSGEIYGQGDPGIEAFSEDYSGYVDPTSPRSCYPASKRAAETLCVSFTKQFGLETVIARPCHTYGPNATGKDNRANVQFVNQALAGEDIVLKSAGTQMRSYCYIADCASALLTILLNGKSGEAYNTANPEAKTTIAGFAQAVADETGVKVVFENPNALDIAQQSAISYAVLDSKKLCALGWHGNYSVEKGVAHTVKVLSE